MKTDIVKENDVEKVLYDGNRNPLLKMKLEVTGSETNVVLYSIDHDKETRLWTYNLEQDRRGAIHAFNEYIEKVEVKTIGFNNFVYFNNEKFFTIRKEDNKIVSIFSDGYDNETYTSYKRSFYISVEDKILTSQYAMIGSDQYPLYNYAHKLNQYENESYIFTLKESAPYRKYKNWIVFSNYDNSPLAVIESIIIEYDMYCFICPIVEAYVDGKSTNCIVNIYLHIEHNYIHNDQEAENAWIDFITKTVVKDLPYDTLIYYDNTEIASIRYKGDDMEISSKNSNMKEYTLTIDPYYMDRILPIRHQCKIVKNYTLNFIIDTYAIPLDEYIKLNKEVILNEDIAQ